MHEMFFLVGTIVLLLGFVVFFGPPYLPTLSRQTEVALDLLDLKPGETLLELGSGDGRVILAAARRGWNVVGVELSPILVIISWILTRKYRGQVKIIWGSYWGKPWPAADGIFTFMLPRLMDKLDQRIEKWHTCPVKLASYAFKIDGKTPVAEKDGVLLYLYK